MTKSLVGATSCLGRHHLVSASLRFSGPSLTIHPPQSQVLSTLANSRRVPLNFPASSLQERHRRSSIITRCRETVQVLRTRSFLSTSSRRARTYKTVEQARARNKLGPFSWPAGLLFLIAGIGMTIYFRTEKERMKRKRVAETTKGIGKPKVGGEFELVDQEGRPFTSENMLGKYSLIYFGFSHCPDICPEELDKMAGMIDRVRERAGNALRPIVISCDPARDTPAVLKKYLAEFHPDMIGLTGSWEQVKATCKAYRVYFSTPPDVKPGQDYLVDHSIYFYLMDPDGDFVEAIGRQFSAEQAAKLICDHIGDWKGRLDKN